MNENILCLMLYLSDNMWEDSPLRESASGNKFSLELTTDKKVWDDVIDLAVKKGINSLLIDVGDGIKFKSHPEIAVKGAWTPEFMTSEVKRLKKMGLKVYPKLNFSAAHDAWLGVYGRMLSTPCYYDIVRDLIHETIDIFDNPELFHIGMDEENEANQKLLTFACYRQFELLWHDINFMLDCVREKGVRPWMWADPAWQDFEEFNKNVGKDVLVSPWYYSNMYGDDKIPLSNSPFDVTRRESYKKLTEAGYDILPCGSNYKYNPYNLEHQIRFSREHAVKERNKGLLVAPWKKTIESERYRLMAALQIFGNLKNKYFKEEN